MRALAAVVATVGLLVAAAPAAAQAPPGANDFDCRSAAPPVILVHGTFGDMTVSWNTVSPALKTAGYCVFALNLARRGMALVDQSADKLAAFIDDVRTRTGAATVSIVGHSQGGLVGRYVAKFRSKAAVIDDIVSLAPPSHGTKRPLAPGAGLICVACEELVAGSPFMEQLNLAPEAPPPPSYTVVSTRYDEVVRPYRSQALDGATNIVLQDRCPEDVVDHVGIIYDPIALQWIMDALGRPGPADPAFVPLCSDAGSAGLPFAFVARRRADNGVRVGCMATVGHCVGRVMVRDRARRLGSAPFDLVAGSARTIHVPLRREPRGRATATVVTLQPGGFVKASLRLRRSQNG
jgi:triacylglycerol lipase